MLTTEILGMALYGLYSMLVGVTDLVAAAQLEWWNNHWLIGVGAVLLLGAEFVRVSMPGGLALAVDGLLALQSISLHNAGHLYGRLLLDSGTRPSNPSGLTGGAGLLLVGQRPIDVHRGPRARQIRRTRRPVTRTSRHGLSLVASSMLCAAASGATIHTLVARTIANHDGTTS